MKRWFLSDDSDCEALDRPKGVAEAVFSGRTVRRLEHQTGPAQSVLFRSKRRQRRVEGPSVSAGGEGRLNLGLGEGTYSRARSDHAFDTRAQRARVRGSSRS